MAMSSKGHLDKLEPSAGKLARWVLRGERGNNPSDLPDSTLRTSYLRLTNHTKIRWIDDL